MKLIECQGRCSLDGTCTGTVKEVEVGGWGKFYYCDTAIKEDRRRGLTVNVSAELSKTIQEEK